MFIPLDKTRMLGPFMRFVDPLDRLMSRVEVVESGCWMYRGFVAPNGYGALSFEGVAWRAHRLSYLLHNGEFDRSLFVCHSCDVRACVNPAHLFLGTAADNNWDKSRKGRCAKKKQPATRCRRGHKLTVTVTGRRCMACLRSGVFWRRKGFSLKALSDDRATFYFIPKGALTWPRGLTWPS